MIPVAASVMQRNQADRLSVDDDRCLPCAVEARGVIRTVRAHRKYKERGQRKKGREAEPGPLPHNSPQRFRVLVARKHAAAPSLIRGIIGGIGWRCSKYTSRRINRVA